MAVKHHVDLAQIAWANIEKFQRINRVPDEAICIILNVKELRKRKHDSILSVSELELIAAKLDVQPERLLER